MKPPLGGPRQSSASPPVSSTVPTAPRTYATLTQLEHDALNARIWGGFHFRDAMADAYAIGHRTARTVMEELD